MNIFKKVISNTETKKLLIKNTTHDVYELETKNARSILLRYNDFHFGKNVIEMLKKFKHPNILQINKCKAEKNNTYIKTDFLIRLTDVYDVSFHFIHYVLLNLAEVILFINKCDVVHNGINFENLYCKLDGKVVLAGFEYAKIGSSDVDEESFFSLLEKVRQDIEFGVFINQEGQDIKTSYNHNANESEDEIGTLNNNKHGNDEILIALKKNDYTNLADFIEYNQDIRKNNIYFNMETAYLKFKLLSDAEKQDLLIFTVKYRNLWIPTLKEHFVGLYINELLPERTDFNEEILNMIFKMNLPSYNTYMEILFSLPISQVRLFLLSNYEKYKDKVSNWNNQISENLILATRCSDENLQIESIRFLTRIHEKLENKRLKEVLKALMSIANNDSVFEEALVFAAKTCKSIKTDESLGREMYRFMMVYLNHRNIRSQVLILIFKMFKDVNINKVQAELLPSLCSFLDDENNQDICFDLIEDIIKYLKINKKQLIKKDWSVKKIGKLFSSVSIKMPGSGKKNTKNTVVEKTKPIQKHNDNGWDENW